MSDQSNDHERQVNLIIAEFLEAERLGRAPGSDELLRQHPNLANELQSFFTDRAKFQYLAAPIQLASVTPSHPADAPTLPPSDPAEPFDGGLSPVLRHSSLPKVRYFGDYELIEEIARGGMGVVYKARQM